MTKSKTILSTGLSKEECTYCKYGCSTTGDGNMNNSCDCTCHSSPSTLDWEKEFDCFDLGANKWQVKDFIKDLLESQKKEILSQWEQAITYSQEKGHYLNRHIMLNHFKEASK